MYSIRGDEAKSEIFSGCKFHLEDSDLVIAALDGSQRGWVRAESAGINRHRGRKTQLWIARLPELKKSVEVSPCFPLSSHALLLQLTLHQ
jgi:hypothetical protein